MPYFGRQKILTDVQEITPANVIDVLNAALTVHNQNEQEINNLYSVYKGKQAILNRKKDVRPEICNKIVVNLAKEIVDFKVGYMHREPIQYVSADSGDDSTEEIVTLNKYMRSESKPYKDRRISKWNHICGTAYYMILPDTAMNRDENEAPFEIFVLDPRSAFVVYLNDVDEPPVMSVKYVKKQDGTIVYTCYTDNVRYDIESGEGNVKKIVNIVDISETGNPIVEYPANEERTGAFEPVMTLLDAINNVQSNRVDGVEQFIQALLLFHNVNADEKTVEALRIEGALAYKDADPSMKGEVKYMTSELNQSQTQILIDDMCEQVRHICGIPNRSGGGASTSDTGQAVEMRDGFVDAMTRAGESIDQFRESDMKILDKVINICSVLSGLRLKTSNIEIKFFLQNHQNLTEKVNAIATLIGTGKFSLIDCIGVGGGLFADPEAVVKRSEKYIKEQESKNAEQQRLNSGGDPGSEQSPAPREVRESGVQPRKDNGMAGK